MTDTNKNNSTNSPFLFENKFAYVTSEGEVKLKQNKFFEERTLADINPENYGEKIKEFEEAFSDVESQFRDLFEEAEAKKINIDSLEKNFNKLVSDTAKADAIGDFESLIEGANQKIDQLKKQEQESEEGADLIQETNEKTAPAKSNEEDVIVAEPETEASDKKIQEKEISEPETDEKKTDPVKKAESSETEEETTEKPASVDTGEKGDEAESTEPVSEEIKKTEPAEEAEAEKSEADQKGESEKTDTEEPADEKAEAEESPSDYYKKLADKAETLMELSDWSYATMEFENLDLQWGDGPDADKEEIKSYREKIDTLREQLEEKKKAHYEQQKKIREENLEKKKDLLNELKAIIENEKWTHTRDVARIKNKWEKIKPIPSGEAENLDKALNSFLAVFDEHKVDRLVKKKQQEEDNLTGKFVILEKMEKFLNEVNESSDWKELDKKLNDYTKQFRKIGRIPAEKNQETWDRFHKAQDTFHSLRFKYDKKYRKDVEKSLAKKKKLIDEAEALIDAEDIAKAARTVNKLHRQWKKIGNLPQKDENDMWDRFKAATDAFNDKKSDNIDQLRDQEDENYSKKLELIKTAEELKESEEWGKTHSEFQKLMDQWKKIGPVPRRKSGKIWKKFKGAMDHFYDRRREFFKEVKEERKDNLKEKEETLDKLKELQNHENPVEAVNLAKPLQEEFKKAGYVPIKHKNRLWKEYREICDVIYERFRAAKSAAQIVGKENVENFSTDDLTEIKRKQDEADKLRKQLSKLSSELLQMKESLSYFKPSGSGSSLLDDVKKKIDDAEENINKKDDKLQQLEIEIDKIKRNS